MALAWGKGGRFFVCLQIRNNASLFSSNFISGFHTRLYACVTDFEQNGNLAIFPFSCDLVTMLDYEGFPGHTICIVRKSWSQQLLKMHPNDCYAYLWLKFCRILS